MSPSSIERAVTDPVTGSGNVESGMMETIFRQILTSRVSDVVRETTLDPARKLSRQLGNRVLLKREDLQPVFSFKLRGACNRMAHLEPSRRAGGVIATSAGNHAQGVAYSAKHLGIKSVIIMPRTTPRIKVEAVQELGAEVVLFGDNFTEAKAHCLEMLRDSDLSYIDPFDDPLVIAGQGKIGEEILRQSHGGLAHAGRDSRRPPGSFRTRRALRPGPRTPRCTLPKSAP